MGRYYFNLFNDHDTIDEEGAELSDDDAAYEFARMEARNQAAVSVREHGHLILSHRIVVLNSERADIATVTFGDAVEVRN